MAKQSINVGTTANDKKGDSLRAAFQKVNTNFTELYAALGLDADTLNIGAFEFVGSTMTTTDSSAIVIDQATTITSNLSVGGDIVPQTANGGDLGSSTLPWRSLYVSNNTIYIGGTAVGLDASGNLTVSGSRVGTTSYTDLSGKPALSTVATTGAYADLTGKPTIPTLVSQLANDSDFLTSVSNISNIRSEGNINIDINLTDSTLRRWQFGEDGELTLPAGAVVKTTSGNLTIKGQNYVYIDSASNGQINIGTSSGVGAVVLGNKSRGTNVVVDDLQVANGVYEYFSSLADATGVVTHNCANGHLFYHTSPDANWTVNLTNLLDIWNRATSVTLIIAQGATGYYPSAVQIAGVAQTINWQGNVTPTPSTNRTDVVRFSIINNSGTYTVLGQLTGF